MRREACIYFNKLSDIDIGVPKEWIRMTVDRAYRKPYPGS